MNEYSGGAILLLLLFGPLFFEFIERNLEAYFFILGLISAGLAGLLGWETVHKAATEPILISAAVVVAGLLFRWSRARFERMFARLRGRISRPLLAAIALFLLAMVSSIITAIVASLILVEVIGMLHLEPERQSKVTIAGCFSIGLGASLTPIGEPLSTLAASALQLHFLGLFDLLAPYVVPGVLATAALAGFFARGDYEPSAAFVRVEETPGTIFISGAKVFVFIAGLVMVSEAFEALATRYVSMLATDVLFWVNMISAVLDNATLVAIEVHGMELARAREIIIALLISGGMLIPGNIPNIISAGALQIRTVTWAKIGIPLGILLLGIYFAALTWLR